MTGGRQPRDDPKIGVLLIATNKYRRFVEPLVNSIRANFLTDCDVAIYLFADRALPIDGVVQHHIEHKPWPLVTLERYKVFDRYGGELAGRDYLYYLDADMLVWSRVGQEILPGSPFELVAALHPGFHEENQRGTYETRTDSTAHVGEEEGSRYFTGAFQGGTTGAFLEMSATLANNIDSDLDNGIVALWHDESHLNRYLIDHPPQVLSPSYCYPEAWPLPFEPLIIALKKTTRP